MLLSIARTLGVVVILLAGGAAQSRPVLPDPAPLALRAESVRPLAPSGSDEPKPIALNPLNPSGHYTLAAGVGDARAAPAFAMPVPLPASIGLLGTVMTALALWRLHEHRTSRRDGRSRPL